MVSLGILPLLERFTMYQDATATPAAWLELYSPVDPGQPSVKHTSSTAPKRASASSGGSWLGAWWWGGKGAAARQQQLLSAAEEQQAQQEQQQAQFEGDLESTLLAQQLQPGLSDASASPRSGPGSSSSSSAAAVVNTKGSSPHGTGVPSMDKSSSSSSNRPGPSPPAVPPAPAAPTSGSHSSGPLDTGADSPPPSTSVSINSSSSAPGQTGVTRVSPASQQRRFLSSSFAFAQGASDYAAPHELSAPTLLTAIDSSISTTTSSGGSSSNRKGGASTGMSTAHGPPATEQQEPTQDGDGPALCVARQAARALSVLCMLPDVAEKVAHGRWLGWLQQAAVSDDCRWVLVVDYGVAVEGFGCTAPCSVPQLDVLPWFTASSC